MPVAGSTIFGGSGLLGSSQPDELTAASGDATQVSQAPALWWLALIGLLIVIRVLWEVGEEG